MIVDIVIALEKFYILYCCKRSDICTRISKFSDFTPSGKDADNIGGDAGMIATKQSNLHVVLNLVAVSKDGRFEKYMYIGRAL